MGSIFISHSEKDLAIVNEIIRSLEQAGYSTWYFERDALPGTSYLVQIHDAVDTCQAIVLVASSNSIGSDQVSKEVVGAFERRKPFFPILLDMTPPQLKECQPEWRHALGGTTMICVATEGLSACITRVIDGLKAIGIPPEGAVSSVAVPKRAVPTPASYTPRHLADKILASRKIMEGERKQVTVLFADVSGFTTMSEKLDPEEVHGLISEALVLISEEVHRYEGTIVQFLGDGIMALFGAPIAHEDAPQRALHAALGIRERVKEYAARLKPKGIEFDMHIGLNTGLVMVGKIGDDLTMEYTAMGDTVKLASRLGSLAQPGTILVSDNTCRLTEGYFDFQPLGEVQVKGKKEPVKAHQLLGVGQAKTRLGISVARGLTPFVGRGKELDHLKDCFERTKIGQGQVVGIVGEPGVGKSRLLLQMRAILAQEEYTYLQGECQHYQEVTAYLPFLDILRSYFGIEEGEPESVNKRKLEQKVSQLDERLMPILPPLQELLSLKVDDEGYLKLEPKKRREKTFEAIRTLLIRESQNKPIVLAIEDLHWIDKTSEEFLDYFIGRLAGVRILLVLLYRHEYSHSWASKTYYRQIMVDELSLETSAEMVQAILKEGKAALELSRLILKRAAGNPLFMEELTRSLLEKGCIERKDHQYVLTVKPSDIQVPETVHGIIAARMDRLGESLKETMQVASVIGGEFSFSILRTITGQQERLEMHLNELQVLEFIYERSAFPEREYSFKHALTQEVAYNSLLLKRRKDIHGKIGKAMEELYHDRLEEICETLAHHYSIAEDWEKAYRYLAMSGTKASNRYSTWEAFRFLKRATDVLGKLAATEENKRRGIEARLLMVVPMMGLLFPEDSIEILKEGERLSEELGDVKSLGRFRGSMGMYHTMRGDIDLGTKCLEDAFQAADKMQDLEVMVPIGFQLCSMAMVRGDYLEVAEVSPRVIALLERTHRECEPFGWAVFNPYSALVSSYGMALASVGNLREAQAHGQKGLRFATQINDLASMAYAECMYGEVFMLQGDGRKTVEHGRNAVRYSEEAQLLSLVGAAWNCLGYGYRYLGDVKAALNCLQKAVESMQTSGFTGGLPMIYSNLGEMYFDSGDLENARAFSTLGSENGSQ